MLRDIVGVLPSRNAVAQSSAVFDMLDSLSRSNTNLQTFTNHCARVCVLEPMHAEDIVALLARHSLERPVKGVQHHVAYKCRDCSQVYLVSHVPLAHELTAPVCHCGAPQYRLTPEEAVDWDSRVESFHRRVTCGDSLNNFGGDFFAKVEIIDGVIRREFPDLVEAQRMLCR